MERRHLRPARISGPVLHVRPPWRAVGADAIRDLVRRYLDLPADDDHLPAWMIGSHDVTRAATRWPDGGWLGLLMLVLALPGSTTLCAGDELGLPEVDLPLEDRRDPTVARSGCRGPPLCGCSRPDQETTGPAPAIR